MSLLFLINFAWEIISRHHRFFYDAWTDTTQISTFQSQPKDPVARQDSANDDDIQKS
ncbi:hypothetical protein HMPREF0530_0292 [Lacticaseibacillus paracasei subsp. paracasei ATCC 25302 = DSM 5622 = JCM 8130]|nr:hypothetical protein HMPREF0530_0292 [Lacticaseibacillus paracasei subsp. paracasei ATCC 25302 = DSM 5622 = JCM 8130]KRM67108.1 hypothetical protein FC74_GL000964 [Lacticaseibacillus paracasei subsp. paracasei ATCC 25302 = DSM 5622 = JCM 8130]